MVFKKKTFNIKEGIVEKNRWKVEEVVWETEDAEKKSGNNGTENIGRDKRGELRKKKIFIISHSEKIKFFLFIWDNWNGDIH